MATPMQTVAPGTSLYRLGGARGGQGDNKTFTTAQPVMGLPCHGISEGHEGAVAPLTARDVPMEAQG